MYPIVLNTDFVHYGLVGRGPIAARRARSLIASRPKRLTVFSDEPCEALKKVAGRNLLERLPNDSDFEQLRALCICDLGEEEADGLIELAWSNKVLVNYEDKPAKCDFHIPGIIRRGDLLMTVSTGGKSPVVTNTVRARLAEMFGPEWKDHLKDITKAREIWQDGGAKGPEIKKMTKALIKEKEWLP